MQFGKRGDLVLTKMSLNRVGEEVLSFHNVNIPPVAPYVKENIDIVSIAIPGTFLNKQGNYRDCVGTRGVSKFALDGELIYGHALSGSVR